MSNADRIRELEAENAALRARLDAPESLRYRALFNSNGLGIALVDRSGRLIECNAALCAAVGRTPEELRGGALGTHTHPDDVAEDRRRFAELVAGNHDSYLHEKRYIRKDGSLLYARLTNAAVRDEHGQVQFVMRIIEDVTARHEAEQALRASRALIHALVDQIPAMVFIKDLEGRFLLVNRTFAATLGVDPAALIGHRPAELYPPEVAAYFRARDQAVIAAHAPLIYEEPYRDAAGVDESRACETIRFPLLDAASTPYAIGGITFEITARKRAADERLQLERKLLEAQKLESLGLMAGGIAHDFNNLLVAVIGNAALALHELPPDLPARAHVAEIDRAARRAAELTRQMLTYAGKSQVAPRPVDLNELIVETSRLLQHTIPPQVALRLQLTPNLPPASGDPTQLGQVVMNLLLNGAEAIAGPGTLTVRTAPHPDDGPPQLRLEVIDSGQGMDAATRARIFEPFFTTKPAGRGLGLATVQGIVRGHGGTIAVTSAPGEGATFRVILPASPEAPAPAAPHTAPLVGIALVADDEPGVLSVAVRMLGRLGLTVLTAASPGELRRLLADPDARADFALVDIGLLDQARAELLAAAARRRPPLPIVLMSGADQPADATGNPAIVAFVAKPFRLPELAATAHLALAHVRGKAP